jgi:hypothetical protein
MKLVRFAATLGAVVLFTLLTLPAKAAVFTYNGDQVVNVKLFNILGGGNYSVDLIDGSCNNLFDECDTNTFAFSNGGSASAASLELAKALHFEIPNSTHINGCEFALYYGGPAYDMYACQILTPYALPDNDWYFESAIGFVNTTHHFGSSAGATLYKVADYSGDPEVTFAKWTLIPEPASIGLMFFGLLGAMTLKRKK